MDLLIDLIDFLIERAQKRGFDSPEQQERYRAMCERVLTACPDAAPAHPAPEAKA